MFCRCQSGYLFRNPQETTHTVALAQWFGQSPFIFRQLLHSKNTSYKVWQEFYTSGRKEVKEGLYFSLEREETKTSHREVYIFIMYLFYQPHACKSNIPLKTFCRKRHSGNTVEAVLFTATITRLAWRDEHQMLSPCWYDYVTVCQVIATSCPSKPPAEPHPLPLPHWSSVSPPISPVTPSGYLVHVHYL